MKNISAKRISSGVLIGLVLVGSLLLAQERVNLTVPQVFTNSAYHVASLYLDWDNAAITVNLKGSNGEPKTCGYTGPTAITLMRAINTANLSVRSLLHRICDRLVADGCLDGVVAGTPQ